MTRLVRLVTAAVTMLLMLFAAGCGGAPADTGPTPMPSLQLVDAAATATPAPTAKTSPAADDRFEQASLVLRVMHTNDVAGYTDPCG